MKKLLIVPFILAGCATHYNEYTSANVKMAEARAQADIARVTALSEIAKTGDATSKVAAAMALAFGSTTSQATLQPPKPPSETLLQAIAMVLPSIAQIYGINRQVALGIEQVRGNVAIQQSMGATSVANTASTNQAFTNIASKIQSNVTTTTTNNPAQVVTVEKPFVVQQDKTVLVRPEVVTTEKAVILRPEVVRSEVVRSEVVRPEVVRPELVRPEVVKIEQETDK